jgi:hypothetical protein
MFTSPRDGPAAGMKTDPLMMVIGSALAGEVADATMTVAAQAI